MDYFDNGIQCRIGKRICNTVLHLNHRTLFIHNKSKKEGKDQETIQSSTTPDPGYHVEK